VTIVPNARTDGTGALDSPGGRLLHSVHAPSRGAGGFASLVHAGAFAPRRSGGCSGCCLILLSLVSGERLRRVLRDVLDEAEFLSPHGVRALSRYHRDHPYVFRVDGQDHRVDVATELSRRLTRIFLRGPDDRRPVHGGAAMFQADPHWRDLILFYEYFHGYDGAGIGASHQTGWTGLVAKLLQQSGE
jgi:hypothetical protein